MGQPSLLWLWVSSPFLLLWFVENYLVLLIWRALDLAPPQLCPGKLGSWAVPPFAVCWKPEWEARWEPGSRIAQVTKGPCTRSCRAAKARRWRRLRLSRRQSHATQGELFWEGGLKHRVSFREGQREDAVNHSAELIPRGLSGTDVQSRVMSSLWGPPGVLTTCHMS